MDKENVTRNEEHEAITRYFMDLTSMYMEGSIITRDAHPMSLFLILQHEVLKKLIDTPENIVKINTALKGLIDDFGGSNTSGVLEVLYDLMNKELKQ